MEDDPRANDRRAIQRRRKFGTNPSCVICGETDPVRYHHLAGQANDPEIEAPVCANCHLRLHEDMRAVGLDLRRAPRTIIETDCAVYLGLAVFFRQLAERFGYRANKLTELTRALDQAFPDWRHLGAAWD